MKEMEDTHSCTRKGIQATNAKWTAVEGADIEGIDQTYME